MLFQQIIFGCIALVASAFSGVCFTTNLEPRNRLPSLLFGIAYLELAIVSIIILYIYIVRYISVSTLLD